MPQSNFEQLKVRKLMPQPEQIKRVRSLEHTAQQLRDYAKRACKAKQKLLAQMIIEYETLAENIQLKLENSNSKLISL